MRWHHLRHLTALFHHKRLVPLYLLQLLFYLGITGFQVRLRLLNRILKSPNLRIHLLLFIQHTQRLVFHMRDFLLQFLLLLF